MVLQYELTKKNQSSKVSKNIYFIKPLRKVITLI